MSETDEQRRESAADAWARARLGISDRERQCFIAGAEAEVTHQSETVRDAVDALGKLVAIIRETGCPEDADPGLWIRDLATCQAGAGKPLQLSGIIHDEGAGNVLAEAASTAWRESFDEYTPTAGEVNAYRAGHSQAQSDLARQAGAGADAWARAASANAEAVEARALEDADLARRSYGACQAIFEPQFARVEAERDEARAEVERLESQLAHQAGEGPNNPEPMPKPGRGEPVWDLVMRDMSERDHIGAEKYGQRLQPHDGRDSLTDAYQEALDLSVYLRKAIEERGAKP